MLTIIKVWFGVKSVIENFTNSTGKANILYMSDAAIDGGHVNRGHKYIIGVEDMETAEKLKETINGYLNHEDHYIRAREIINGEKYKPYKLNIKIVNRTLGEVKLRINDAKSTMQADAVELASDFDRTATERKNCDDMAGYIKYRDAAQAIREYVLETGKDKVYLVKECGTAYRVSYYDKATERRKQISVGDVLIMVGALSCHYDSSLSRQRSDRTTAVSDDVITYTDTMYVKEIPEKE